MFSFDQARKNMVDCQIHPAGVVHPKILEAFKTVPRELFMPEFNKSQAYCDEDIIFKDGRFIIEPATHARMIDALQLKSTDIVLDIGCAGGYSSAIISEFVTTVIALENVQKYLDEAQAIWDAHGFCNIAGFKGNLTKGCTDHAPYDAIILNGSVAKHPIDIASQLTDGGKMIYIYKDKPMHMGKITLAIKTKSGQISTMPLHDAASPYLAGFSPEKSFTF